MMCPAQVERQVSGEKEAKEKLEERLGIVGGYERMGVALARLSLL